VTDLVESLVDLVLMEAGITTLLYLFVISLPPLSPPSHKQYASTQPDRLSISEFSAYVKVSSPL
jgi:hypothetical protein